TGAGLATAAFDIERKSARRITPQARFRRERVKLADLVEQADIRGRHRARRLADGSLIDFHDALDRFPADNLFVRPWPAAELAEMELEPLIENLPHQGALAGAGDAGDAGPHAERNF